MKVKKAILPIIGIYSVISASAAVFEPRSGELFQTTRGGPGEDGRIVWNLKLRKICHPVDMKKSTLEIPEELKWRKRTEKADDGTIRKAHYGKLFLYNGVPRSYFTLQPNELSIEEKQR